MPNNVSCRHEITVLMCEPEKPYPVMVFAPAQKVSAIVSTYSLLVSDGAA